MKNLLSRIAPACLLALSSAAFASNPPAAKLKGDYVEARTCNVYTGACHAMSEATTTGSEAILAWRVTSGTAGGVKLDGLTAVAAIAADSNLAHNPTGLHSVLYIDASATEAQRDAFAGALRTEYGRQLGTISAVKTANIEFARKGREYTVRVPDTAYVKTTRFLCEHCVMPHATWYEPLVSLKSSIVAASSANEFKGSPELSTRWNRPNENSSFVGEFVF